MNRICISLTKISILILAGFLVGLAIASASARPLVCKVYTWDHPEGRVVRCLKVGSDVRNGGEVAPTDTPYISDTATPEPTDTDIPWEPWSTSTRTATPPFITHTPYPEPEQTGEPYP